MRRVKTWLLAAGLSLALFGPSAASSQQDAREHADIEHDDSEQAHHRHHLGGFFGAAMRDAEGLDSGFAIGVDYHYRFFPWLSAGLLVETATGDLREAVVLAPFTLHPWRGSYVLAAPGVGVDVPGEGETEFTLRLGLGYGFPIGQLSVGPEFAVDLIEWKPTYVIGLAFGVGF